MIFWVYTFDFGDRQCFFSRYVFQKSARQTPKMVVTSFKVNNSAVIQKKVSVTRVNYRTIIIFLANPTTLIKQSHAFANEELAAIKEADERVERDSPNICYIVKCKEAIYVIVGL